MLDYRPLLSSSLPSADVFTYLGREEEGHVTLLEDEAENLHKEQEKMKIYRSGYRKGATCPRIDDLKGRRTMNFWKTFCCKIFAGLWLPYDRGFKQRCIEIPMVEGYPMKDEFDDDDFSRLNLLRVKLLAWRMKSWNDKLPKAEVKLHGSAKELWKPKIQISYLFLYESNPIVDFANEEYEKKIEALKTSLDAHRLPRR